MARNSEAVIIADIFNDTRGLTKFFLSKIPHETVETNHFLEGQKLNNAYWITAHMIWAQYSLQILCTDGPELDIPWLAHYAIGSDGSLHEGRPSFEELLVVMEKVHRHCQTYLRTLTDEQLDEPANATKAIKWETTKRRILSHSIRHEGQHAGHLSWICKLSRVKTV